MLPELAADSVEPVARQLEVAPEGWFNYWIILFKLVMLNESQDRTITIMSICLLKKYVIVSYPKFRPLPTKQKPRWRATRRIQCIIALTRLLIVSPSHYHDIVSLRLTRH
jgi:hypothetical protein